VCNKFEAVVLSSLLLTSVGFAQAAKPTFSLTISTENSHVKVGESIFLHIVIMDISDHDITCRRVVQEGADGLDMAFDYDVKTSDHRTVASIPISRPAFPAGKIPGLPCQLEPGSSVDVATQINIKNFKVGQPGTYLIRVSQRDLETKLTVISNKIEVVVDGAGENPTAQ
jgi:hypothetical protein